MLQGSLPVQVLQSLKKLNDPRGPAQRIFRPCRVRIQPGRRLGTEMSDYAKKCGVGGIFHTDELPAYGITSEEVKELQRSLGTTDKDCIVLVAATPKQAHCAAMQVIKRARLALDGVPEETRKMLPEGNTAYMRPLPGAARMYPETDVLPELVEPSTWDRISLPELLTVRAHRFSTDSVLMKDLHDRSPFLNGSRSLRGRSGIPSTRRLPPALSSGHSKRSTGTGQISR